MFTYASAMKNPVNIKCPIRANTSGYVKYGVKPNTRSGICRNGNAIKSPIPSIFFPITRYPNPQIIFKRAFLNFLFNKIPSDNFLIE